MVQVASDNERPSGSQDVPSHTDVSEQAASSPRSRATAEYEEAVKALKAAVPGSVVAGWIERRVANARKALQQLDDGCTSGATAGECPQATAVPPRLLVEVDEGHLSSTCSTLASPYTQGFSRPSSLFDEGSLWPVPGTVPSKSLPAQPGTTPKKARQVMSPCMTTPHAAASDTRKRPAPEGADGRAGKHERLDDDAHHAIVPSSISEKGL